MSDEYWDRLWRKRRPFFRSGIFENVDEMFREMEEMMQKQFEEFSRTAPKALTRERTLPNGSKIREWGPFVYGYSVTVGQDGRPQFREFGNVKPETKFGRPKFSITEQREPLVDVIQTDGEIKIIAELPGVEKQEIKLHGTENTLTISVSTYQRKYHKEVQLPNIVYPKESKSTYKNGVLKVTLKKKKKPEGEPITL